MWLNISIESSFKEGCYIQAYDYKEMFLMMCYAVFLYLI